MAEPEGQAGGSGGFDFVNVAAQYRLPNQRAILAAIAAFEKESDVKVIFASESSSRSIGTAHKNSDHDIVAIYVHRRERYFSMRKMPTAVKKVFPEQQHQQHGNVPEIEMVAWEARHAFTLLADSTLALLDAFYSPLIYCAIDFEFSEPAAEEEEEEEVEEEEEGDDDEEEEEEEEEKLEKKKKPATVGAAPNDNRGTSAGASAPAPAMSSGLEPRDAWSAGESSGVPLPTWVRAVQNMIWRLYSRVTLSWAAWGQASTNFQEYVVRKPANGVRVKKYLHVTRRILLQQWFELSSAARLANPDSPAILRWPPPCLVSELIEAVGLFQKQISGSGDGGATMPPLEEEKKEKRLPPPIPESVVTILQNRLKLDVRWQLGVRGPKIKALDEWIESELARIKAGLPKKRTLTRDAAWDDLLMQVVDAATEPQGWGAGRAKPLREGRQERQ